MPNLHIFLSAPASRNIWCTQLVQPDLHQSVRDILTSSKSKSDMRSNRVRDWLSRGMWNTHFLTHSRPRWWNNILWLRSLAPWPCEFQCPNRGTKLLWNYGRPGTLPCHVCSTPPQLLAFRGPSRILSLSLRHQTQPQPATTNKIPIPSVYILRYVGVIWFVLHALQLLPIRFARTKLRCINKSTM